MPNQPFDLDRVIYLYDRFSEDLLRVREEQSRRHWWAGYPSKPNISQVTAFLTVLRRGLSYLKNGAVLKPQLDDLEAEITYLRLRDLEPETVVEISPCGGWSSTWILSALRDNQKGRLFSYDLVDISTKNVPRTLGNGRWQFTQGDVTKNLEILPKTIDYLFIDSDHSAEFAEWYIANLFSRLKPGTPVSVHDVYHLYEPDGYFPEGKTIIDFLKEKQVPFFTASKAKTPQHFERIEKLKKSRGMGSPIHRDDRNSMIFFNV